MNLFIYLFIILQSILHWYTCSSSKIFGLNTASSNLFYSSVLFMTLFSRNNSARNGGNFVCSFSYTAISQI